MIPLRFLLTSLATLALTSLGLSQAISLSFNRTVDISSVPLTTVGDLAIDRDLGHLYLCDGAPGGQIFRVDANTGSVVTTQSPATIPGLTQGPDALAISDDIGLSEPFVFSPFDESRGGRMTLSNTLVADFGTAHDATGADTTSLGALWVASGTAAGGGTTLRRLNPSTGAVIFSVALVGVTERAVDIAYDPWFDGMWVLLESGSLRRVNLFNGATTATFNLNTLVSGLDTIHGGIAFGPVGTQLFVARGTGTTADSLVVLDRQLTTSACTGDGASGACPCGNNGSAGRGCDNSAGTGGALLRGFGIPQVSNDFLQLRVEGLPGSTTCLFYQGTSVSTPATSFGDGLRCVAGTVIRLATKVATAGAASYPVGAEAKVSVRGQVPVTGGTRHYQAWYRNAATFCTESTFNLSNGVSVEWRP
ncbi:MAG: hypothetical protein JNK02_00035 [Planctomycetes bacterium]|nr:hypothetical protein [Planctomycetota bacterium]